MPTLVPDDEDIAPSKSTNDVVPTYDELFRPFLESIQDGQPHTLEDVAERVAASMDLSEAAVNLRIASGRKRFQNRIGWARTGLHKAGLVDNVGPRLAVLTTNGAELLGRHPGPIDEDLLKRECATYADWIADMGGELPQESRAGDQSTAVWMVRAGQGGAYAPDFIRNSLVMVGWGATGDVNEKSLDEIATTVAVTMSDLGRIQQGQAANALFRIAHDIRLGDLVITPEPTTRTVAFGRIDGAYKYHDRPIVEDYCHTRPVHWFARIDRDELSYGASNSLGTLLTLTKPRFQDELTRLAEQHAEDVSPEPLEQKRRGAAKQQTIERFLLPSNVTVPQRPPVAEFHTVPRQLMHLLDELDVGQLALPDFQRSFVWSPNATRELLVSMIRSFPAGALLFLQGGSATFQARAVEGAPPLSITPSHLVLDGQQRLTSLYQAMLGVGDSRFFLDIGALLTGADVNEAVRVFAVDKAPPFESTQVQAQTLLMPLSLGRDASRWRDDVVPLRTNDNDADLRRLLRNVEDVYIKPLIQYQFPVTLLAQNTQLEAVTTIFETLNRTGVPLTPFELISARAFASGQSLRDLWINAQEQHRILVDFDVDPYYILQCIAIRLGKSAKRSTVLSMTAEQIADGWDDVVTDMADALTMVRDDCGVLVAKWLPYRPMLIPLTVAWMEVSAASGPAVGAMREKLKQWFWCACFTGEYESSSASLSERDAPLLRAWLAGDAAPLVVSDFSWDSSRWQTVTVRQQGLYKATIALMLVNEPRDFHTGARLTKDLISEEDVDDHHIFPRSYLRKVERSSDPDTVLNHCLIDRETNLQIGSSAPSAYLTNIHAALGVQLDGVLNSQAIPSGQSSPLWRDDFDAFRALREELLEQLLRASTGQWSHRAAQVPPNLRAIDEQISAVELSLRDLIAHKITEDPALIPPHVSQKVSGRLRADARKNPAHVADQPEDLRARLNYADLRELQDIITSKSAWPLFESAFGTKEGLGMRFTQLAEMRNALRHSRAVDDVARKDAEAAVAWFRRNVHSALGPTY